MPRADRRVATPARDKMAPTLGAELGARRRRRRRRRRTGRDGEDRSSARSIGYSAAATILLAVLALHVHTVTADEEEAAEEAPEWSVTVCYHTGLDCMDEAPLCMDRTADDEDGLGTCSAFQNEDTGEIVNTSPFPSDEGFLRISCATDKEPMGPLPMVEIDGIEQKVLTLDWFKKDDCTDRMCLHTVDLENTMCEAPSCLLELMPGQMVPDQDPECQCADPPSCRAPAPMSCGMCTAKYPQGWENGKCINLCMDGSDGWADGSANDPGTESKLLYPNKCNFDQLASAVVTWDGMPCENKLRRTGLIVLSTVLVPTGCVILSIITKWIKRKEMFCWKPNGRCCGKRCGRIVITLEDPNAGLSKYEIKMKERNRNKSMDDKWAQHRRAQKKDEKRHEKLREAAFLAKNKTAGAKVALGAAGKAGADAAGAIAGAAGRSTKVRPAAPVVEAEKSERRKQMGSERQMAKEAKKEENRLRAEERRRENQERIKQEREEAEQAKRSRDKGAKRSGGGGGGSGKHSHSHSHSRSSSKRSK